MKFKFLSFVCLVIWANHTTAQVNTQLNNPYYTPNPTAPTANNQYGINASPYSITILSRVLYNAKPDGYHVTYTKSFISLSVASVEQTMNAKTEHLIQDVKRLNIAPKEVMIDIIALDPIFSLNLSDSSSNTPIGYKITENITFKISNLPTLRKLSKICLDHEIYDLIKVQAFLNDSSPVLDSLAKKAVEVLDMKKKLSEDIGWKFQGGKISFKKRKQVYYPNERYLKSLAQNATLYQHDISQNTSINFNRRLNIDNHYDLNYKNADFEN